ncbi:hypothetical protein ACIQU5_09570 [Streptomyces sp. NPDC090306]|uniref:hypothetical protein n=1 Tax=Streptomyces sp. NPDC090306 TaxID=3365961 RepID=UPI00381C7F60
MTNQPFDGSSYEGQGYEGRGGHGGHRAYGGPQDPAPRPAGRHGRHGRPDQDPQGAQDPRGPRQDAPGQEFGAPGYGYPAGSGGYDDPRGHAAQGYQQQQQQPYGGQAAYDGQQPYAGQQQPYNGQQPYGADPQAYDAYPDGRQDGHGQHAAGQQQAPSWTGQPYQHQNPQQPQDPQQSSWGRPGDPGSAGAAAGHAYADPHAGGHTQQWQGQTWETQIQPPVPAVDMTETAYLPPQNYDEPPAPQGHAAPSGPVLADAMRRPLPPEAGERPAPAPVPQAAPAAPAPAAPANGTGTGAGETWGPATLAGNARVTDAQRARAEGRSPIIEPGMQPAALTALLALLMSGAAAVGSYALLVPLVVLQAVTAAGWFRLNGMWPARQGIAVAFLGALVSDVALLAAGRDHAPAAILGTLGVWVLFCLVLHLRSHAEPDERMYGLMATVCSAALAIVATGHLAADPDAVTVGAAAVAVAILARALPLPTPASVVVSVLAGAGAGIAVGAATDLGANGALLGAGAAACALVGHRAASYDYPSRFVHFTAGVALPLAAAAPAVYALGRVLG